MKFLKVNWPKLTWAIGLALFFLGEGVSAFNATHDDTASEFFRDAPRPLQFGIFGFMCAVLAHWVWQMPPKIEVPGDLNLEIHEHD